jgi:CHAT domain-containing protein
LVPTVVTPAPALRQAQAWLRDATNADLAGYARAAAAQGRLQSRQLAEIEEDLSAEGLRASRNSVLVKWITPDAGQTNSVGREQLAHPYAHPYFWGGFIYTGL